MNFDEFQKKIKALSPANSATKVGQTIVVTLNGERFTTSKSEDEVFASLLERIRKEKQMKFSKKLKSMEWYFD